MLSKSVFSSALVFPMDQLRFFSQSRVFGRAIPAGLAALAVSVCLNSQPAQASLEDSPKTVVDEVWQIVNKRYAGRNFNQGDWQRTRQELLSKNYTSEAEAYQAIQQALKQLGDPYTRFLEPKEYEELTSRTSGELTGVGLQLEIEQQSQQLTVVEPLENSPAMQAGIRSGDKIIQIDEQPTAFMNLAQATEALKGPEGTEVRLKISRAGQGTLNVTLTRAQVEMPSVDYAVKQEDAMRVGYIKLDEFSSHSAEQMQRAIADLSDDQIAGFVLDLRGNPGGLLFASIDIARMWMPEGAIVRTVERETADQTRWANGTALTDLPLVILVDNRSASASEILAGALQESNRATVVGTRTYGKGTVQSVHSLSDGSGLAVTVARYYPPSGINISRRGIVPDVELDLSMEQQRRLKSDPSMVATKADPQYARAIALLRSR